MKDFFKTTEQAKKDVRLGAEARERIRGTLMHMMRAEAARSSSRKVPSRFGLSPVPVAIFLVAMLLVGGGTSLAAETAQPGDFLYPVKVGVNEEVVATLSLTPESKARWEVVRAERRLQELADLTTRGDSDNLAEEIEDRLGEHAENVRTQLAVIQEQGDAQTVANLSSRFEASLSAHEQIFARIRQSQDSAAASALTIVEDATTSREVLEMKQEDVPVETKVKKLRTALEETRKKARENAEERDDDKGKSAAEKRLRVAQEALTEARKSLSKDRERVRASAVAERLRAAQEVVDRAWEYYDTEEFRDAFGEADEAFRAAQEARIMIEAQVRLHLDLFEEFLATSSINSNSSGSVQTMLNVRVEGGGTGGSGRGEDGAPGDFGSQGNNEEEYDKD